MISLKERHIFFYQITETQRSTVVKFFKKTNKTKKKNLPKAKYSSYANWVAMYALTLIAVWLVKSISSVIAAVGESEGSLYSQL